MGCEHIVDMVAWILRARIGRVGLFWELNDFIAVFNRLNSIGREGLVLNVRDLGTVN